ncbi:MAG: Dyp-type peroxidase [Burkholderiaceae bacterium]
MQTGILKTVPHLSTYLSFNLAGATTKTVALTGLKQLLQMADGQRTVVGFSAALCKTLSIKAPKELRAFKTPTGGKLKLPETPVDLLVWLRATPAQDRGDLLTISRQVQALLGDGFVLTEAVEAFKHLRKNSTKSHDLTGYEDGTENPKGQKAVDFGFAADGSSFLALQKWQHKWDNIAKMSAAEQNQATGRNKQTNAELETAPPTAHIKRTTQEDFTLSDGTEGFTLRRSMPWSDGHNSGLMFAAFGKSFEAFDLQLARMVGADDGITDAVFKMSKPITGCFFWCPPVVDDKIKCF